MSGKKHLILKGRTWWFHRDIPAALRPAFEGRKTITRSLKTSDFKVAQLRRDTALAESTKAFRRAAEGKPGETDTLTALAIEWAEEIRTNSYDPEMSIPEVNEELYRVAGNIEDERGAEAREQFLAIAHGDLPLDHYLDAHLIDSGLPARSAQERRTAVLRVAKWRPSLTMRTMTRRAAGEYVSGVLAKGHHTTGNKALWNLRAYWTALETAGNAIENPWTGHSIKRRKDREPDEREREPTDEEITTLLSTPYPSGWSGGSRLHDAMRIAALSGMRIDEICRLTVADCQGGLFDIRRGKTKAGKRKVPIHSTLLEIVERRLADKAPGEFLFHDIEKKGTGERSMPLSKQFTRYRRTVGVDDCVEGQRRSLVNFHSFRRWFATMAERAHQPPHVISFVMGHARAGETLGTYSGGPSVDEQLRAVVEAVKLPTPE